MTPRAKLTWTVLAFVVFSIVTVPPAHAYVDPGTGSYVFQILIGALLGAAVAVKLWWRRLWALVTRKPAPPKATKGATPRDEAE
jgi:cytochrome b561